MAANAITQGSDWLEFTVTSGANDWDCTSAGDGVPSEFHTKGICLRQVTFQPSAANDVFVIKDGSATGPVVFWGKAAAGSETVREYPEPGLWCKPYIDASDCTFDTSASIVATIRWW